METHSPILLWFRHDLRLDDHPALSWAAESGRPVLPVFLLTPEMDQGGAARWWLHHALSSCAAAMRDTLQAPLILRQGEAALHLLQELIAETGATSVVWNRRYEPDAIEIDTQIKTALADEGIEVKSFRGSVLWEPHQIQTGSGTPYKVFTPYSRNVWGRGIPEVIPSPTALRVPDTLPPSAELASLKLLPTIGWDQGFYDHWDPGLDAVTGVLEAFSDERVSAYKGDRDFPAIRGTSRLSPYLHFGQISPRRIWTEMDGLSGSEPYIRQLIWRDFSRHVLFHFPHTLQAPLNEKFSKFPWTHNEKWLKAWQQGQTGYPLVDAGMRELWHTGWMHNRVRMVVGSFLVKHLLQHWQEGEAWFMDTLVDADKANNIFGWQWIAGCGADAAPYFRIFNPITQSEKFDRDGDYIRKWIPELRGVFGKVIHTPWEIGGHNYVQPIVGHKEGRERALEALATLSAS